MSPWLAIATLLGCRTDAAPAPAPGEPVSPALRRLTRAELRSAVQELTGSVPDAFELVPADVFLDGFDNQAEALTITPYHATSWLDASRAVADEVLRAPGSTYRTIPRTPADPDAVRSGGALPTGTGVELSREGDFVAWPVTLAGAGTWQVELSWEAWSLDGDPVPFAVLVDGAHAWEGEVRTDIGVHTSTVDLTLPAGSALVGVALIGEEPDALSTTRRLNLWEMTLRGPSEALDAPTPAWDRWMTCDPESGRACAARVLDPFAAWAWRRPLLAEEVDRLLAPYDLAAADGASPTTALRIALQAVLLHPSFLFHDEPPGEPLPAWALANRLAWLLWGEPPDAELRAAAESLADPAALAAQVDRMLDDPRSDALIDGLGAQWLGHHLIENARPDPSLFPTVDDALRASMVGEARTFFRTFLASERPIFELVDGRDGWVDATLAAWYGLAGPVDGFASIDAASLGRGGVLGQAGLQMALSHPTRTHPVRRGAWVLTRLLCDPPDPPPPMVPALPEPTEVAETVPERLAEHRANPACAGCHAAIDPIGLAMEHFDAVGRRREEANGAPVDASATLPDGTPLDGLPSLQAALVADPRLLRCAVDTVFTWSHHRAPGAIDVPFVDAMEERARAEGASLRAILRAAVTSPTFRAPLAPAEAP